jgi:hypothetical protein
MKLCNHAYFYFTKNFQMLPTHTVHLVLKFFEVGPFEVQYFEVRSYSKLTLLQSLVFSRWICSRFSLLRFCRSRLGPLRFGDLRFSRWILTPTHVGGMDRWLLSYGRSRPVTLVLCEEYTTDSRPVRRVGLQRLGRSRPLTLVLREEYTTDSRPGSGVDHWLHFCVGSRPLTTTWYRNRCCLDYKPTAAGGDLILPDRRTLRTKQCIITAILIQQLSVCISCRISTQF